MRTLFILLVYGLAAAAAPAAEPLRLASFNLRNYLTMNRHEYGQYRMDYPKPEAEKACVRELLLAQRPDILFLQESGSEPFVRELRDDLRVYGLDFPYFEAGLAAGSSRSLGLLSRLPPQEVILHDPVPAPTAAQPDATVRRGIQEVLFAWEDRRLRVFHVHLKSRWSDDPAQPQAEAARQAEMTALIDLLARRTALASRREALLLLGDFNAPRGDPLFEQLERSGWTRLALVDAIGADWTYLHARSGSTEAIDAMYIFGDAARAFAPLGLYPESAEQMCGSDHRLLMAAFAVGDAVAEVQEER